MLAKLTLEQKIELIGGVDDMFTNAMPAIGFPASRCLTPRWACAPGDRPPPMRAAQPWPPPGIADFAQELGESLGKDARARGVNFLLGPGVNIARSPVAAATSNTSPKTRYLNGALVVPYIEGVQSQGVIATVKHYALNNQEYNRHNVDVRRTSAPCAKSTCPPSRPP